MHMANIIVVIQNINLIIEYLLFKITPPLCYISNSQVLVIPITHLMILVKKYYRCDVSASKIIFTFSSVISRIVRLVSFINGGFQSSSME